ncbi:MAG: YrbL family protein [Pseudomonadota bacterium]
MIDLSGATILGEGAQRRTYIHPTDESLLLKVQVRPFVARKHWYDRPMKVPSSNERELIGWADVIARLDGNEPFLSQVHGLEDTSEGSALLVENAALGAEASMSLRNIVQSAVENVPFTAAELRWAHGEYLRIAAIFDAKSIYNHSLRLESMLLCRFPKGLSLKLMDYKSMVYRQFISPRLLPGAQRIIQRKAVDGMAQKLDRYIAKMEASD